jgi:CheY-like chemotaxis protein
MAEPLCSPSHRIGYERTILRSDLPSRLPRYPGPADQRPDVQTVSAALHKARPQDSSLTNDPIHVFVVDDQSFVASTLADILRLSGFSAIPFTNPREALQAARFDSPDLLISEIEMPRLSGIDLAIQLKAMYLDSNILLVSRHADCLDLLEEAGRIGPGFHVTKSPIGPRRPIAESRGLDRDDQRKRNESSSKIRPTAVPV